MYHALSTEWPCLSFDVVKDNLGDSRHRVCNLFNVNSSTLTPFYQFPLTIFTVCGSQADRRDKNKITLLKLSELHKTQAPSGNSYISVYIFFSLHDKMIPRI